MIFGQAVPGIKCYRMSSNKLRLPAFKVTRVKYMKTSKQLLNNQEAQHDDILPVDTWHEML